MIALLLMQQIAVLFLIMGLGFLIVKLGIVETEDSRVLSMVTIYLVLPCVTIHAFQIEYSTKIRNGFLLAVARSDPDPCNIVYSLRDPEKAAETWMRWRRLR